MVVLTECSNMFWGLKIYSGKEFSQTIEKPFHLSMAALQLKPDQAGKQENVQVMVVMENKMEYLLCTLGHAGVLQQQLDLSFGRGETVCFYLQGNGVVYLSGSLIEEEQDFPDDYRASEYDQDYDFDGDNVADVDSDDEDDEDWEPGVPVGTKRKAFLPAGSASKKLKIRELDGDEEDEDDEDEDEFESSFIDDSMEEEEEESDSDEEDGGEEESLFEELQEIWPSGSPSKKSKALNSSSSQSEKKKKKDKSPKVKDKKAVAQPSKGAEAPVNSADGSEKKKKKRKKKKKQKQGEGETLGQKTEAGKESSASKTSPAPGKKHTGAGGAGAGDANSGQEATPGKTKNEAAKETPGSKTSPAAGKKRTVAGGVVVEDSKVGHGPEAKPGKMVHVYYSGTLAKNNKRFDSCLNGKPFRFRMGKGEVIKGWDTGLIGMKVGGKRRITVPPAQGYGNSRQGPIPAGSTLVFDVELKAVN